MSLSFRRYLSVLLTLWAADSWAAQQPHIGYIYPAGARQGTTVKVTVGGQYLKGAEKVHFLDKGLRASVIQFSRQPNNLNKEQRQLIEDRLKEVKIMRFNEQSGISSPVKSVQKQKKKQMQSMMMDDKEKTEQVKMPQLPLLHDLENKSIRELEHIKNIIFMPRRMKQLNKQIAELVLIEITVEPNALPGNRELRIETKNGLTNPIIFQVGTLPETTELEPNGEKIDIDHTRIKRSSSKPKPNPIELPVVINGQIMPGDVDRFQFTAQKGQELVIEAQARSLIPYLADAVPGWFQAMLTLYDSTGKEIAFADDYRFKPDPVLLYKILQNGEYELQIRDAIYRGREDFVYHISIGQTPFITQMFPLGSRQGVKTVASIEGWNLPANRLPLDTTAVSKSFKKINLSYDKKISNLIPYAVDSLAECDEEESNNSIKNPQKISLPKIINGKIQSQGDIDVFRFEGKAGDKIVAEVYARRLNSPLDSLLRLTDRSGKVLRFNDDHVLKDSHLHKDIVGLVTHHADSYLLADLTEDGTYYIHLSDTTEHGGKSFGYRLRLSNPIADFALRVIPSSLYMRAGSTVPITVHAMRKDGFNGPIEVIASDTATGFKVNGALIPAGYDSIRMTVTAPGKVPAQPIALQIQGRAHLDNKTITNTAVAADDVMQAFLYRHLVPARELMVAFKETKWPDPSVELAGKIPVQITKGNTSKIQIKMKRKKKVLKEMRLKLTEPPDGLTIQDVTVVPEGLEFNIKADKDAAVKTGFKDNLIIEVFREYVPKRQKNKPNPKKSRYSMGFFPAIPIEIVQQ